MGTGTTAINKKKITKKIDPAAFNEIKTKLQKGLAELEKQYKEVMTSVEKNKTSRLQIEKEKQFIHQKIKKLSAYLNKFSPYAQRQMKFLEKLKEFQKENEALVMMIAQQLDQLENPDLEVKNDAMIIKQDLLKMLHELGDIKKRRESLLQKINS